MNNVISIEGHTAVISFDPDLDQFRGEFTGLNGGADFHANSVDSLHKEGAHSLKTYLVVCKERGTEPYKSFSSKLVVFKVFTQLPPERRHLLRLSHWLWRRVRRFLVGWRWCWLRWGLNLPRNALEHGRINGFILRYLWVMPQALVTGDISLSPHLGPPPAGWGANKTLS